MFQSTAQPIKHRPMIYLMLKQALSSLKHFLLNALISIRNRMHLRFFIAIMSLLFWTSLSHAQAIANSAQFAQAEQAALYQELLRIIRCPTCQNQDIAESNAPLAKQLRDLIATQIQAGKTRDEIVDYLVARYGDFITYAPRLQKNTLLLWFAPLLVMLFALVFWLGQRKRHNIQGKTLSPEQMAQLQQWLMQYGEKS